MPPSSTSGARYHSVTICSRRRINAAARQRARPLCAERPLRPAQRPQGGRVRRAGGREESSLVGVALHGHAESTPQAQVGDLEDVLRLVHQQVLRLQVPAMPPTTALSSAHASACKQRRLSRGSGAHRCITPWRWRWAMPRQSWYMKFWRGAGNGLVSQAKLLLRCCSVASRDA